MHKNNTNEEKNYNLTISGEKQIPKLNSTCFPRDIYIGRQLFILPQQ